MSQFTLLQGLLLNFKGEIEPRRREYLSKKEAYEQLKLRTGQDFGEDFAAWKEWIQDHPMPINVKDRSAETSQMISDFLSKK